jgi:hypothetical protein
VPRLGRQNHQVRDVDDAHAQGWADSPQEFRGLDDLEGDLDADAREDDVWLRGGVGVTLEGGGGGEGPDGDAQPAVLGRFVGGEVDGGGLLGADDQVGLVARGEAVVDRGEEAVGVGWEVDLSSESLSVWGP